MLFWLLLMVLWLVGVLVDLLILPSLVIAWWLGLRATAFWFPIHWWFVAMFILGSCLFMKGWVGWYEWRNRSR
jgi:hypothetical protein